MALVIDIAANPRLTQMLGRIEEARRALDGADDRAALEAEISALYQEVGRYTHWLMRQEPETIQRLEAEARKWVDNYDLSSGVEVAEIEAVEEVEIDELEDLEDAEEVSVLELTADSEASSVDVRLLDTDVQGDRDRPPVRVPARPDSGPQEYEMGDWEDGGETLRPEQDEPVYATATMPIEIGGRSGWTDHLQLMLAELGEVERDDAVRKVIRGTMRIEARWSRFPESVQAGLCRLLAARIRQLQGGAEGEQAADLRLAIGRLRSFADTQGLAPCAALDEAAGPDTDDWEVEEARARAVLESGLS